MPAYTRGTMSWTDAFIRWGLAGTGAAAQHATAVCALPVCWVMPLRAASLAPPLSILVHLLGRLHSFAMLRCLILREHQLLAPAPSPLARGSAKLVGPTISCEGSPWRGDVRNEWRASPHVQSYAIGFDQVALQVGGGGGGCWEFCLGQPGAFSTAAQLWHPFRQSRHVSSLLWFPGVAAACTH